MGDCKKDVFFNEINTTFLEHYYQKTFIHTYIHNTQYKTYAPGLKVLNFQH